MRKGVKFREGYKYVTEADGSTIKYYPGVRAQYMRRISKVRLERLNVLRKMFLKDGKSVQEIAKVTGWRKDRIYQEMYYMKRLGMLPPGFKNPFSVWTNDIVKEVERGGGI